jgi:hypothetical protein
MTSPTSEELILQPVLKLNINKIAVSYSCMDGDIYFTHKALLIIKMEPGEVILNLLFF